MNEVTTTQGKIDLARARAGEIPMPQITHMALGTGGHVAGDPTTPVPPDPGQTELDNEVLRKPVTVTRVDNTVKYSIELGETEGNGEVITEAGLIDNNGALVAVKTFGGKTKEVDTTLVLDWTEDF